MDDPVLVDIIINFHERPIRIKAVLDAFNINAITFGKVDPKAKVSIPVGASFTLVGRVSDWKDKDGQPKTASPAGALGRVTSNARRAARRGRARGRKRTGAAPQVHGDGAA